MFKGALYALYAYQRALPYVGGITIDCVLRGLALDFKDPANGCRKKAFVLHFVCCCALLRKSFKSFEW